MTRKYMKISRRGSGKSSQKGPGKRSRRGSGKRSRRAMGKLRNSLQSFANTIKFKRQIKRAKNQGDGIGNNVNNRIDNVYSLDDDDDSGTYGDAKIPNCPSQYKIPIQCVGSSVNERKQHYRKQSKNFHPDKNRGCIDESNEKQKKLETCCKSIKEDEYSGEC